jgi:hypothetical protein
VKYYQRMKKVSLLILLILCFSGCTEKINVDFNPPTKKLVFYPVLTNDTRMIFNLSASTNILSDSFPVLRNPKIFIEDNNVSLDTVNVDNKGQGLSKIQALPGHLYNFKAIADGYSEASCSSILPLPPEFEIVDTLYQSYFSIKYLEFKIKLIDNVNSNDFYKATIYRKEYVTTYVYRDGMVYDTSYASYWKPRVLANSSIIDYFMTSMRTYMMAEDEITFEDVKHFRYKLGSEIFFDGREFYFSDALFNGKEILISLIAEEINRSAYKEKYVIEVTTISEDLYKGLKSYAMYGSKEDANLPFSEEVSIYSAVKGGYGFPVAYTTKVDTSYSVPGLK